jgi:hypothetical protein
VLELIEKKPPEEEEKTLKKQKKEGKFYSYFIDSKTLKKRENDVSESKTCKTYVRVAVVEGEDGIYASNFIELDKIRN